jgi:hypothetical protein
MIHGLGTIPKEHNGGKALEDENRSKAKNIFDWLYI